MTTKIKLSQFPEITSTNDLDLIEISKEDTGNYYSRKITFENFKSSLNLTPENSHDIYVDCNRTDQYVEDGSSFRPYKTMRSACNSISSASSLADFNDTTKRFYCFKVLAGYYDELSGGEIIIPFRPVVTFDLTSGATLKCDFRLIRVNDVLNSVSPYLGNMVFSMIGSNNRPCYNNGYHSYVGILGNLTLQSSTSETGYGFVQVHLNRCGVRGVIEVTGGDNIHAKLYQVFCWNNSGFDTLKSTGDFNPISFYAFDNATSTSGNVIGNLIGRIGLQRLSNTAFNSWSSIFVTGTNIAVLSDVNYLPSYNELKAVSFTRSSNVATVTLMYNHGFSKDLLPDGYDREQYILITGATENTSFNTPTYGALVLSYPSSNTIRYVNTGADILTPVATSNAKMIKGSYFGNSDSSGFLSSSADTLFANTASIYTHPGWNNNIQPGLGQSYLSSTAVGIGFGYPAIGWIAGALYVRNRILLPGNGYQYKNVSTAGVGRSGTVQPTFPTIIGNTVNDGSITWKCEALTFPLSFNLGFYAGIELNSDQVNIGNAVLAANFQIGYSITGTGIPSNTTITAINGGILTISNNATATNPTALLIVVGTSPISYNVQQSLELLHDNKNIFHDQLDSGIAGAATVQKALKIVKGLVDSKPTIVSPPTAENDPGVAGQIAYDSNNLYVCVATNSWKKLQFSAW